jgi:putative inorganic carbon (HCO3(-)) transporter
VAVKAGLRRWGWLILGLAAPAFLFPAPLWTPLLLIAPLVVWAQLDRAGLTPLDGLLLLVAVMLLVSEYATYDLAVSLPKIAGLLLGLAAYFVAARRAAGQGWPPVLLACLAGGTGVAVIGLAGTAFGAKIPLVQPLVARLPARLGAGLQPNEVAGALLWTLPLAISAAVFLLVRARDLGRRAGWLGWGLAAGLAWPAAGLMLATLIATQSRSAYLGLAAGLVLTLLAVLPGRARWAGAAVLVLALIAGGAVLVHYGPAAAGRDLLGLNGDAPLSSLDGRLEIWSRALYGLQDFPFTGMGMNTFRQIVHVLYPLFLIGPEVDIGHAHNEFLQAGLDLGIPGLIGLMGLYAAAVGMLARIGAAGPFRLKVKPDRHISVASAALVMGLGGGLGAHFVYGLTDAVALGAKPGILFWILLGLISGLYKQATSQSFHGTPPHPNVA